MFVKRIRLIISMMLIIGFVVSCSPTKPQESVEISEEDISMAMTVVAETQAAHATNTPLPSPTSHPPTETPVPPTEIPLPSPDQKWARNYVGWGESGGVTIEIARVLVGYKSSIPNDWDALNEYIDGWSEIDVVGELVFKITNNTDSTVTLYPDQGSVQIGGEQIELTEYMFTSTFGDDVGGDIFPGVTKIGGIWFGIKRSVPSEITQIIFRASAPHNSDTYDDLGPDYEIILDVSEHVWEEMPDELK